MGASVGHRAAGGRKRGEGGQVGGSVGRGGRHDILIRAQQQMEGVSVGGSVGRGDPSAQQRAGRNSQVKKGRSATPGWGPCGKGASGGGSPCPYRSGLSLSPPPPLAFTLTLNPPPFVLRYPLQVDVERMVREREARAREERIRQELRARREEAERRRDEEAERMMDEGEGGEEREGEKGEWRADWWTGMAWPGVRVERWRAKLLRPAKTRQEHSTESECACSAA